MVINGETHQCNSVPNIITSTKYYFFSKQLVKVINCYNYDELAKHGEELNPQSILSMWLYNLKHWLICSNYQSSKHPTQNQLAIILEFVVSTHPFTCVKGPGFVNGFSVFYPFRVKQSNAHVPCVSVRVAVVLRCCLHCQCFFGDDKTHFCRKTNI